MKSHVKSVYHGDHGDHGDHGGKPLGIVCVSDASVITDPINERLFSVVSVVSVVSVMRAFDFAFDLPNG